MFGVRTVKHFGRSAPSSTVTEETHVGRPGIMFGVRTVKHFGRSAPTSTRVGFQKGHQHLEQEGHQHLEQEGRQHLHQTAEPALRSVRTVSC